RLRAERAHLRMALRQDVENSRLARSGEAGDSYLHVLDYSGGDARGPDFYVYIDGRFSHRSGREAAL
ncbi:MAG TPA: hypothetical protein VHX16_09840, partial [Chloroflexota bacterium]|nr:hypothetical protein [Chloroflexota bacterium]